jgi:hypothetical protein
MLHPRKIIIENNLVFVFKTVVYLNLKKHISNVFYALKLLCTKLTKTIRMPVMIQMLGFFVIRMLFVNICISLKLLLGLKMNEETKTLFSDFTLRFLV